MNHQHSEQHNGSSYHVVDDERWILLKWRTEHWKAILFQTFNQDVTKLFALIGDTGVLIIRNSHIFIDGAKCAKRVKYLISCICNWNNFNEGLQKYQLHDKSIKLTEIGFSSVMSKRKVSDGNKIEVPYRRKLAMHTNDHIFLHRCSNIPSISITKPHLLIAPLSIPRSHYLTVLFETLSSKFFSTGLLQLSLQSS